MKGTSTLCSSTPRSEPWPRMASQPVEVETITKGAWPRGHSSQPQPVEVWPGGYPAIGRRPVKPARPGMAGSPSTVNSAVVPSCRTSLAPAGQRWQAPSRAVAQNPTVALHDQPRTPQKVPEVLSSQPDDETPPKLSKPNAQWHGESWTFSGLQKRGAGSGGALRTRQPSRKCDSPAARSPVSRVKSEGVQEVASIRRTQSDGLPRQHKNTSSAPQLSMEVLVGKPQQAHPQPAAVEPLRDFSVVARRYGAAAAACPAEDMPVSLRHALNFIRCLPSLPCTELGGCVKPLLPARSTEEPKRPTLVLDLDETLVHCSREGKSSGSRGPAVQTGSPDLVIEFDLTPAYGSVFFRPFVHLFLEVAARSFEIVVFTASQQAYADKVLNALDPEGTYIRHRLYRQHCTEMRGAFFKELGLLGRPLSQCILVDNSPISVACNADHGVLIQSWYGDRTDHELVDLLSVLQDLQLHGGDVDRYLESRYGLREFFEAMRVGAATR